MACYIFSQEMEYIQDGMMYEKFCDILDLPKYVVTNLMGLNEVREYEKIGITSGQLLEMYRYFTDNRVLKSSMSVEEKLEELKESLCCTSVERSNLEIRLVKDGYIVAQILLSEKDKACFWAILYFSMTRLIRMEFYTDKILYANCYVTASSENGLYAKLTSRFFYNKDGTVAYEQIFEGEREWFLFPDGKRFTKEELMMQLVRKLELSEQDVVLLDASVPEVFMKAIFMFGKAARIVALTHVGYDFVSADLYEPFWKGHYYDWFPYVDALNTMVVSSEEQKDILTKELRIYHCHVPNILVASIDGKFVYAVLLESYGGNLALSWNFKGKADGFWIYDESGRKIHESENIHEHYFLIRGYEKSDGFVIKAFVNTSKGKVEAANSGMISVMGMQYDRPRVSLIMPAYNAEEYIARSIDSALAQSFADMELIIVNDGSTDRTQDVMEWYGEHYPQVRTYYKTNGGQATARNVGIEQALGNYIAFMDSDDMLRTDMIERLYVSIVKNECDIAITSAWIVLEKGYESLGVYSVVEDMAFPIDVFLEYYSRYSFPVVWNKLYRASLVKEHPFINVTYEDDAWTPCVLSYAERVCYINAHLYEYDRTIRNSTYLSGAWSKSNEEIFLDHRAILYSILEKGNPKKRTLLKRIVMTYVGDFKKFSYPKYRELEKEIEKM